MILHFLLGLVATSQATSFYIQPFSQFTHEASAIVRGRLSNLHSDNGISANGQKIIYTYATLEVEEVLKGQIPTGTQLIRELGGTKDGATLEIPGTPELKEGEDTVLFLGPENSDQSREITGLELGKFGLEDKNGTTTLTGGLFNYSRHNDHNAPDLAPENLHPWTLADMRGLVKSQGGRDAPPLIASTPTPEAKISKRQDAKTVTAGGDALLSATGKDSPLIAEQMLSDARSPNMKSGPSTLVYATFSLAAVCLLFFLFRKR